jgi:hypothetical protein
VGPHPGTKRRILISDYCLQAAYSIEVKLTEAQLHLHHLIYFHREASKHVAGAVRVEEAGRVTLRMPARSTPGDDLPSAMKQLHGAGVARSVASALDCLAAVIIGVAALPVDIRPAGLGNLRRIREDKKWGSLHQSQRDVVDAALAARDAAGPAGWCDWALGYRSMLVHRARRMSKEIMLPGVVLYDANGFGVPRVEPIEMLPKEPSLSEVEVLAAGDPMSVLTESSEVTLRGAIDSTRTFANDTAAMLRQHWATRRAAPSLIAQPKEQWPKVLGPTDNFQGYRPGSVAATPDTMIGHPRLLKRIAAASLDGEQKKQWPNFD